MSIHTNILSEAELAKTTVMNSPLDDDTKRNLVLLISKATHATNGITPEEKIQSLTECMATLASSLALYMSRSDTRLAKLETTYIADHPLTKAEQIQKFERLLTEVEQFRNVNGIAPQIRIANSHITEVIDDELDKKLDEYSKDSKNNNDNTITDKIFSILEKPYVWIFGAVAICSPFAVDVITTIVNICK